MRSSESSKLVYVLVECYKEKMFTNIAKRPYGELLISPSKVDVVFLNAGVLWIKLPEKSLFILIFEFRL